MLQYQKGGRLHMKKVFVGVIVITVLICMLGLTACHFDSNVTLEEDSQIKAVTVKYADGVEIELEQSDIDLVIGEIKSNLDNFRSDEKILVNSKWDYEYDYTFNIKAVRRVMFSKEDINLTYRIGTTGIFTDSSGKKSETRYENEITYLVAGARWICDGKESAIKNIRERLDSLKADYDAQVLAAKEKQYLDFKDALVQNGYTVTDLTESQLLSHIDAYSGESFYLNASKGFMATKYIDGYMDESYFYWSTKELVDKIPANLIAFQNYLDNGEYFAWTSGNSAVFKELFWKYTSQN